MTWQEYQTLVEEHEWLKKHRPDLISTISFIDRFRQQVKDRYGREPESEEILSVVEPR